LNHKTFHAPSGLLNLNKPPGLTSHDVVAQIRRLTGQRRVGHAGTLDPLATGVLLVCLGQATRLIEYLMTGQKQYRAVIRFGLTTNTLDSQGQVIAQADPFGLSQAGLMALLPAFTGEIEQIPPIFSALKKDGRPLYQRARAGEKVEVEPRRVTIHTLTVVAWQPPDLTLDVTCSPGTYIRSLAHDLGQAAGVGAHLARLTRTTSGGWRLDEAVSLETLVSGQADWRAYLHPPDRAVNHLPAVTLTEDEARRVNYGQVIQLPQTNPAQPVWRAYTPTGSFLAILTLVEPDAKLWHPKKVFSIVD
jgi:tRNA pseudouridine55 synthase